MSYKKKWQPSKAQKREFAQKMQDPEFAQAYTQRKEDKANKRRDGSNFDYNSAGGMYVPTKEQHDFCFRNIHLFETPEEQTAMNIVMSSYSINEKCHHDYIHIVNEKRRANANL